jgi:thiamine-monophosphate kinase
MKTEFAFIEKIRRRSAPSSIKTGIGDDCAVISKDAKTDLVMTADLLVEDIDFRLDWTIPEYLGHKALAVSLSDVGAMGAKPVWAMLSLGLPKKIWKTDFIEKFYDGWFRLAKKFGVELIGGDVSRTPDKILIDSIVVGEVKKNRAILRSGAKPKNLVFVTGNLGGAAGGLTLLESGERFDKTLKNPVQKLLLRQLKPDPQIQIGRILSEKNLATAMIDLSDGLSSDLGYLCRESQVGARIFAERIPVDKNLKIFSTQGRSDAKSVKNNQQGKNKNLPFSPFPLLPLSLSLALNGGEDFELLFTVNPKKKFRLEKELKNFSFSQIGEVTANAEIIELEDNSERLILHPKGFRHF